MLATGDLGYLDAEGDLFVVGRIDDQINTGRVKVYPSEIENAILRHPDVIDCAVFALPSGAVGQEIGALLQLARDVLRTDAEVKRFLAGQISSHKIPAHIWTQTAAFRDAVGKLNRAQIARHYGSRPVNET